LFGEVKNNMKHNMKRISILASILIGGLLLTTGMASAHFTMVFPGEDMDVTPEDYIASVGDTKTIWIVWGHPYEHILFDMTSIPIVSVRDPEGKIDTLTATEITVSGKKAYEVSFTVDKLGDWIVSAEYEDDGEKLVDYVKAVIHCGEEAWTGWDANLGGKAEIVPLTRPYGLEEGFVFTANAFYDGKVLPDADVEIEMYHTKAVGDAVVEKAEEMFSYDPPMMFTRVTKTNALGEFAYTLDEPGIWFVCAYGPEASGLTQRSVFIIPVLEEFPPEGEVDLSATGLEDLTNRVKSLEDEVANIPAGEKAPGFAAITAIIGMMAVGYLLRRRK